MRVHSDLTCLHPVSEDILRDFGCAFTPQTFELSFSHRVALSVSLSDGQLLIFAILQEDMNHSVFIASTGFQTAGSKQTTPTRHQHCALLCEWGGGGVVSDPT